MQNITCATSHSSWATACSSGHMLGNEEAKQETNCSISLLEKDKLKLIIYFVRSEEKFKPRLFLIANIYINNEGKYYSTRIHLELKSRPLYTF